MEIGEHHWQNGWYFKRLEDGSVRIRKYTSPASTHEPRRLVEEEAVIPPDEWASIVASVCLHGGNADEYERAGSTHMGGVLTDEMCRKGPIGGETVSEPVGVEVEAEEEGPCQCYCHGGHGGHDSPGRCCDGAVDVGTEAEGEGAQIHEVPRYRRALERVKSELGVPGDGYPAPMANAYFIAEAALYGHAWSPGDEEHSPAAVSRRQPSSKTDG